MPWQCISLPCATDYKPSSEVPSAGRQQAGQTQRARQTPTQSQTSNYRKLSTLRLTNYPDSLSGQRASNIAAGQDGSDLADCGRRDEAFGTTVAFDSSRSAAGGSTSAPSGDNRLATQAASGIVLGEGDVIEFRMLG